MEFTLYATFNVPAKKLFHAFLDSAAHTAMTGAEANVSAETGAEFTAWEGYISGKNLEIIPFSKIVQAWRTTDFNDTEPDSIVELNFAENDGMTTLSLHHYNLPEHGVTYKQGWKEYYFAPMRYYFSK